MCRPSRRREAFDQPQLGDLGPTDGAEVLGDGKKSCTDQRPAPFFVTGEWYPMAPNGRESRIVDRVNRPDSQFLIESDTGLLCTLRPAASYAMLLSAYRPLATLDVFQEQIHPTKVWLATQIN
jgi:hypothetical protein